MPYILLKNGMHTVNQPDYVPSASEVLRPSNAQNPQIVFLVHERPDNIGGVQRHSARLEYGLKGKYNIQRFNWKNPEGGMPFNFLGLHHNIAKSAANLIYCDDGVSSIVATRTCGNLNRKLVATVHGLDAIAGVPGYQRLISKALQKLDRIICVSRATREQVIKRGIGPDKIEVIPNAAEPVHRYIEKNDALLEEIKHLTGIDLKGKKVLFSLGRPLKRKGFDRFIEKVFPCLPDDYVYLVAGPKPRTPVWKKAFGLMLPERLQISLQIALGNYTVHERLLKLSEQPGAYYINGVNEHLRNLLFASADLFIMPNISVPGDMEGFGIVALEASVRRVPVIATGIEGITDAVVNGQNGYCIAENDDSGFARSIISLYDSPDMIASLGKRAKEFALKEFSLDSIAGKYASLFESQLASGRNEMGNVPSVGRLTNRIFLSKGESEK